MGEIPLFMFKKKYPEHLMHLQVRRLLFVFLARPSEDHEFLNPLLALGRTPTDCYIGLCHLEMKVMGIVWYSLIVFKHV